MTDTRGGPSKETDRPPQSTGRAELAYFSFGCIALTIATILLLFEQGRNVQLPRGLYAILAAGIVLGGVGWTVVWSVGRAEERVRAAVEDDLREVSTRLAELTSLVQALRDGATGRPKPATCRAGVYTSRASLGDTVGIRISTVDGLTDPAAPTVQRAREDGLEQGFEIGYRAQLAERGVTPLPTARRPRLMGDS